MTDLGIGRGNISHVYLARENQVNMLWIHYNPFVEQSTRGGNVKFVVYVAGLSSTIHKHLLDPHMVFRR